MTRRHRRVDAPGTGAAAAVPLGAAEPVLDRGDQVVGSPERTQTPRVVGASPAPTQRESERDRWLREQRPPHWGTD